MLKGWFLNTPLDHGAVVVQLQVQAEQLVQ